MKYILPFVLFTLLFSATTSAAVIKLDIRDGQLHGASNINIDGTFYDVEFFDGTCEGILSGCNETSDFFFNSLAAATKASQAIIDFLLVDSTDGLFGNVPSLTFGCEDSSNQCSIRTAYQTQAENWYFRVFTANATNFNENVGSTRVTQSNFPSYFDMSDNSVFARWSLADSQPSDNIPTVSEPSALALFALPLLLAFGGSLRRRIKK